MFRARTLVSRLIEAGLVSGTGPPLLIAGAGAAGVTAAIYAQSRKIPSVVFERNAVAFSRQAQCRSRWLDPAQYDWPLSHWQTGKYEWAGPAMPLRWRAQHAANVAIQWNRSFLNAQRPNSYIRLYHNVNLIDVDVVPTINPVSVEAKISDKLGIGYTVPGSVLLVCTGPGEETCRVGSYSGFKFWDTDPFAQLHSGKRPSGVRVLISGGGDGALQDFLRIATGCQSAKDIYHSLFHGLTPAGGILLHEVEKAIQSAEDQSHRALLWGHEAGYVHTALTQLHDAHRKAIDRLWGDGDVNAALCQRLDILAKDSPPIRLVYRCTHFSRCYALNRFLVLLIKRYAESLDHPKFIFIPRTETCVVASADATHQCNNLPQDCLGVNHSITVRNATCTSKGVTNSTLNGNFNVVIVRHQSPATTFSSKIPFISLPSQLLPYHSPI